MSKLLHTILVCGDSHLSSENYGYHLNYPKEVLYYEKLLNKLVETEDIDYYINTGDFTMNKEFSLQYRATVDDILKERKELVEGRGGKLIYIRGNHDISTKSMTEYDYYANRGVFIPAIKEPFIDFKNDNGDVMLHLELRDYNNYTPIQNYGKTNILCTHGYFLFDHVIEGDDMAKYGEPISLTSKTEWEGLNYILAGHIHTEHIIKGLIGQKACTVHYLPCLSRPSLIKKELENPILEGSIDLIKVYDDNVDIERVPIEFLDNKVCFNLERLQRDQDKLETMMLSDERKQALKSMAEELQSYEHRETDPIKQVMNLANAQEKHKNIVKEWFEEAADLIKTGK